MQKEGHAQAGVGAGQPKGWQGGRAAGGSQPGAWRQMLGGKLSRSGRRRGPPPRGRAGSRAGGAALRGQAQAPGGAGCGAHSVQASPRVF